MCHLLKLVAEEAQIAAGTAAELNNPTSRLRGQLSSGEAVEDIQELHCRLRRTVDNWRFAAIEIVAVLEQ